MIIKLNIYNVLIFIFVLALIFPMFWLPPYADDTMRFYWGYIGLTSQGRPVTQIYYQLLCGSENDCIIDTYYLNLLISIAMISFSLFLFFKKNINKFVFVSLSSTVALISSPFLLQNLSFHVDSIGMVSSFCLSLISATILKRMTISNVAISSFILIVATLSYQASINIYISCVALFCMIDNIDYNRPQFNPEYLISKILTFLISIIAIYIVNLIIIKDNYVSNHATLVSIDAVGFERIINSYYRVINMLHNGFNGIQKKLLIVILSSGTIGVIYSAYKSIISKNRIKAFILILSVLGVVAFLFVPAVLFTNPVIQPRVFMSFGFLLAVSLVASSSIRFLAFLSTICFGFYAFTVLATSSTYVMAANKQMERQNDTIKQISSDIRYGLNDLSNVKIKFSGTLRKSKAEIMSVKSFPVIGQMLNPFHGGAWDSVGVVSNAHVPISVTNTFNNQSSKVVLKASDYDIYRDGDEVYLVKFK